MSWNFNIDEAPRGTYREVKSGKSGTRTVHSPHLVIVASSDMQTVTLSRWLPDQERWNMLSKNDRPVAWMEFPKHPGSRA